MTIKSFTDLDVYQRAYRSAVIVMTKIIPNLPAKEKFDLVDQLARSSKAIAPLIAEGFAKKHQPRSFKKYIDDALGESNEVIVHLSYCKDIYYNFIDTTKCNELIEQYNVIGKQLNRLGQTWQTFK